MLKCVMFGVDAVFCFFSVFMQSLESHKKFNLLCEIHRTAVYANEQHEIRWILIAFIILHTMLNYCSPEWAHWNCNYHENELKSCSKCKNEKSSIYVVCSLFEHGKLQVSRIQIAIFLTIRTMLLQPQHVCIKHKCWTHETLLYHWEFNFSGGFSCLAMKVENPLNPHMSSSRTI